MSNVFGVYGSSLIGPSRQVSYNASTGAVLLITFTALPDTPILFMLTPITANARVLQGAVLSGRASGIVRSLLFANTHYPMYIDQIDGTQNQFQVISDTTTAGTLELSCVSSTEDFTTTSA